MVTIGTKYGPVELLLHGPDSITARNDAAHSRSPMDTREQLPPLKINGVQYGLGGTPLFPHPDGSGLWIVGSRSTYEKTFAEEVARGNDERAESYSLHQAWWAARPHLSRLGSWEDPTPAASSAIRDELNRAVSAWCAEHFSEGAPLLDDARAYQRADRAGSLANQLDRLLRDELAELIDRAEQVTGVPGVLHKLDVVRRGLGAAAVTLREVERGER
jgi:hypothetical protein